VVVANRNDRCRAVVDALAAEYDTRPVAVPNILGLLRIDLHGMFASVSREASDADTLRQFDYLLHQCCCMVYVDGLLVGSARECDSRIDSHLNQAEELYLLVGAWHDNLSNNMYNL
jgi:hypothetical protein